MSLLEHVQSVNELHIRQKRELAELIGFETRNKYTIETPQGMQVGFAAEQQKGVLGFFLRQLLGHWRTFEILFFNADRQPTFTAIHPFRLWLQRLEVYDKDHRLLGALQQRFAFFTKRFDMEDAQGRVIMSVASPFWHFWTFAFQKEGREVARIEKKWTGFLAEAFTDKDRFRVLFSDLSLSLTERQLLVASALFVDLQYFERKAD